MRFYKSSHTQIVNISILEFRNIVNCGLHTSMYFFYGENSMPIRMHSMWAKAVGSQTLGIDINHSAIFSSRPANISHMPAMTSLELSVSTGATVSWFN